MKDEHGEEETERSEQLSSVDGIYALGDCCANIGTPLPALAQVPPHPTRHPSPYCALA
jgi:NADH dehydrogenase FAD-containing subunit